MTEFEIKIDDKPKYEKPLVIDLSEPLMGEGGDVTPCSSGPSGNNS